MNTQTAITFTSRRKRLPVLVLTAAMQRDALPVMLARRAMRVANREPGAVAAYEARHAILARGKK